MEIQASKSTDNTSQVQIISTQPEPETESTEQVEIAALVQERALTYKVPGGLNTINVSATVREDTIEQLDVSHTVEEETSERHVTFFDQELGDRLIGKSLEDIEVTEVVGASLTSQAFYDIIQSL